ncbi:MAG TPA: transcription antitermination factor NusB [Gemmatales bacterium]|nr:transcription antitermination factor NusB [Gemmatales bacterium]HMP59845.1 transcription antitermination factor NusB [Gemmatales bacterium]
MARRSRAREVVLQLLYQHDQNPAFPLAEARQFLRRRLQDEELAVWGEELYVGTLEHRTAIDEQLSRTAENWSVHRMAVVDRNLLRLCVFEMTIQGQTPARVVIDEAVELAKRYGSAESPAFVNGILDRLAPKPEASPPSPPAE